MELFKQHVVRLYSPRRRATLRAAAVFCLLLLLYGSFEWGRYDAGFRVVVSTRAALAADARIAALASQNEHQRAQLEAADVARRVDREGYRQVERSLGDMQSQIARLTQDLSFYRGLVQPDSLVHVKVQQMQIVPEGAARQFHLKFVLMQTGKPEKSVAGSAAIAIDGLMRAKPTTLGLGQVTAARRSGITYSFRYFQEYDEAVELPAGFEPTRISVEIFSVRDLAHGFRQAFVWKAQGMSLEADTGGGTAGRDNVVQSNRGGNVQVD